MGFVEIEEVCIFFLVVEIFWTRDNKLVNGYVENENNINREKE